MRGLMMDDDKLLRYVIVVALALLFIYLTKERAPYVVPFGIFWVWLIVTGYAFSEYVVWKSRYEMSHVCVNGVSGSILGRPVVVKGVDNVEWAIFNLGECTEPVHLKGKLSTLVVPFSQINRAGRNYVGKTFVSRVPLLYVPNAAYRHIVHQRDDFSQDNVYYGKYSEGFIHENPSIVDFDMKEMNLNNQINFRDKLLEGHNDTIIEQVEAAKTLTGEKDKWYKALPGFGKKEDEQE